MNQRLSIIAIASIVASLTVLPLPAAIAQDGLVNHEISSTGADPFSKTKQGYPINSNDAATLNMVRMCENYLTDRLGSSFLVNISTVRASFVSNSETRYTGRGSLYNSRRTCDDYSFNCIVNIRQAFVASATFRRSGCRLW